MVTPPRGWVKNRASYPEEYVPALPPYHIIGGAVAASPDCIKSSHQQLQEEPGANKLTLINDPLTIEKHSPNFFPFFL